MLCPFCGAENDLGTETCFSCGRNLFSLTRGTVLSDRYEILATLGRGGMGMVYKAHDRELDETVAIKLLRADVAHSGDAAKRFRNEIRLARRIRHRNVCAIHEYGQQGHLRYIVMEYLEGTDFKEILRRNGPLPVEEACAVAIQVAEALHAIHDAGVIHRDLKTPNIMRDLRGVVRLMDFGIAKQFEGDASIGTATGLIVGTPEYMSPEQARAEKVDARSDIYALGIVLYELLTGAVPLRGDTPLATLLKHLSEPPQLDSPLLPDPLPSILGTALSKDRNERYQSAEEMATALRQLLAQLPVSASPAQFQRPSVARPRRDAAVRQREPLIEDEIATTPIRTPVPTSVPTYVPPPVAPPKTPTVKDTPPPLATPKRPPSGSARLSSPPRGPGLGGSDTARREPRWPFWKGAGIWIASALVIIAIGLWVALRRVPSPGAESGQAIADPPPPRPGSSAGTSPTTTGTPTAPPLQAAGSTGATTEVALEVPAGGEVQVRGSRVSVRWDAARGADAYQLMVSRDQSFSNRVVEQRVVGDTGADLRSLAPGTYYWRVAAARGELRGPFGNAQSFTIRERPAVTMPSPASRTVVATQPSPTAWVPPAIPAPTVPPAPDPTTVRPAEPESGFLQIGARPYAEVAIDGKVVGTTPLRPLRLSPGVHVVQLVHPGYRPLARRLTVRTGETTKFLLDWGLDGIPK